MAQTRFETLSKLKDVKDDQRYEALEALSKEAQDMSFAREFVQLTGDRLLWSILENTEHPEEMGQIINALLRLLRCGPALLYASSEAGKLLPLLMKISFDDSFERFFPQVLKLVVALLGYLPLSFRLFTGLNENLAKSAGQKPFHHFVNLLVGNIDIGLPACRLLVVVLNESILESQFDEVVKQLKEVGVLANIDVARSKAAQLPKDRAEPILEALDELKVACTGSDAEVEAVKAETMRRSAENSGQMSLMARLIESIRGIDFSDNLPEPERTPEEQERDALQEILQGLHGRFEALTSEQQESVDETRKTLSETLEKQQQFFLQQLKNLEEKSALSAAAEASKCAEEIMEEVDAIKEKQRELFGRIDKSREVAVERAHIHRCRQTWIFYQTVQLKLNEILLAYRVMASRLVGMRDNKTKAETAGEMGITLLGASVPLPGIKAASAAVTKGLRFRRQRKREKVARGVSHLGATVAELEDISELCARILALRYEDQLRMCSYRGVKKLGECGVRRILASLQGGQYGTDITDVISSQDVAYDLANAVYTDSGVAVGKKTGIEHDTLKKANWNEESIFQKPGILTPCGKFFSGGDTKPGKYGYRIGSLAEALELELRQDVLKRESRLCLTDMDVMQARTKLIMSLTRPISAVRVPVDGLLSSRAGLGDAAGGADVKQLMEEVASLKGLTMEQQMLTKGLQQMFMEQQAMLKEQAAAIQRLQAV